MIPLFANPPKGRMPWIGDLLKVISVSLAGSAASSVLGFFYAALAFAAGESKESSLAVVAMLIAIGLLDALLGAILTSFVKPFPWLVVLLTPLFVGTLLNSCSDCFLAGAEVGGIASLVFLAGALLGRRMKRRNEKRSHDTPTESAA